MRILILFSIGNPFQTTNFLPWLFHIQVSIQYSKVSLNKHISSKERLPHLGQFHTKPKFVLGAFLNNIWGLYYKTFTVVIYGFS